MITAQKMKFSTEDFFCKCDQIRSFLQIRSHLLKKSLMENFIFCAVDVQIKLNRKILFSTESVKCLGMPTDKNLNQRQQINHTKIKLNRADALLYKMKASVSSGTLKSIYFAIFGTHLNYANLLFSFLAWAQITNALQRTFILQRKALRAIYFKERYSHTSSLFQQNNILKFKYKIQVEYVIFLNK